LWPAASCSIPKTRPTLVNLLRQTKVTGTPCTDELLFETQEEQLSPDTSPNDPITSEQQEALKEYVIASLNSVKPASAIWRCERNFIPEKIQQDEEVKSAAVSAIGKMLARTYTAKELDQDARFERDKCRNPKISNRYSSRYPRSEEISDEDRVRTFQDDLEDVKALSKFFKLDLTALQKEVVPILTNHLRNKRVEEVKCIIDEYSIPVSEAKEAATKATFLIMSRTYTTEELNLHYSGFMEEEHREEKLHKTLVEDLRVMRRIATRYGVSESTLYEQAKQAFAECIEDGKQVEAKLLSVEFRLPKDFTQETIKDYIARRFLTADPQTCYLISQAKNEYDIPGKLPVTDAVREGLEIADDKVADAWMIVIGTDKLASYYEAYDFSTEERAEKLRRPLRGALDHGQDDIVFTIGEMCQGSIPRLLKHDLTSQVVYSVHNFICGRDGRRRDDHLPNPDGAKELAKLYELSNRDIISHLPWSMASCIYSSKNAVETLTGKPCTEGRGGELMKAYALAVKDLFQISDKDFTAGISDMIDHYSKNDNRSWIADELRDVFEITPETIAALHSTDRLRRIAHLSARLEADEYSGKDADEQREADRILFNRAIEEPGDVIERAADNHFADAWITRKGVLKDLIAKGAKADGDFLRLPIRAVTEQAQSEFARKTLVAVEKEADQIAFMDIEDAAKLLDALENPRKDGTVGIGFMIDPNLRDFAAEQTEVSKSRLKAFTHRAWQFSRTLAGKAAIWTVSTATSLGIGAYATQGNLEGMWSRLAGSEAAPITKQEDLSNSESQASSLDQKIASAIKEIKTEVGS